MTRFRGRSTHTRIGLATATNRIARFALARLQQSQCQRQGEDSTWESHKDDRTGMRRFEGARDDRRRREGVNKRRRLIYIVVAGQSSSLGEASKIRVTRKHELLHKYSQSWKSCTRAKIIVTDLEVNVAAGRGH